MAPNDFSGVIPVEFSTQIIQEAIQQSAALTLGTRVPMGTKITQMPVPKTLPKAAFVSTGGRKPYTNLDLQPVTLTAEEIAAVTAIPDAMLEDSSINLWAWVRPRLAEAIAVALDDAVFFGVGAPATWPAGGIANPLYSTAVPPGDDAVDTVNLAMSAVESQGLNVTGHAADLTVKGALRGVRDANGALLMGTAQVGSKQMDTIYGVPAMYTSFSDITSDFFTGAWGNLIIGVRSDIRYDMNPAGVIADDAGKVVISGWQDNTTPLKVWARFACVILNPVTVRVPTGAKPFALTDVVGGTVVPGSAAKSAPKPASTSSGPATSSGPHGGGSR
jgi:HK97 family phage major capsid protein